MKRIKTVRLLRSDGTVYDKQSAQFYKYRTVKNRHNVRFRESNERCVVDGVLIGGEIAFLNKPLYVSIGVTPQFEKGCLEL